MKLDWQTKSESREGSGVPRLAVLQGGRYQAAALQCAQSWGRTRDTGKHGGTCGLALAVRTASRGRAGAGEAERAGSHREDKTSDLILHFQLPGALDSTLKSPQRSDKLGDVFLLKDLGGGHLGYAPWNTEVLVISERSCVYGDKEGLGWH